MSLPLDIGRYQIIRPIARGGMGDVYLARFQGPGGFEKRVVLKIIHQHLAGNPEFNEMFLGEAKLVARLMHPNIVQVLDFGDFQGSYYLVMEFIDGYNLKQIHQKTLEFGRLLPVRLVVTAAADVCGALEFAHRFQDRETGQSGIIHRDISPQNILVSVDGQVKLTDFGIAIPAGGADNPAINVLRGKIAYMSPEQARGECLDHRSDIFSLGIVLYELLTGVRLFHYKAEWMSLEKVRKAEVPPLLELAPDLPETLAQIIHKMLMLNRQDRYQSARDVRQALMKSLAGDKLPAQSPDLGEFVKGLFRAKTKLTLGRLQPSACQSLMREQASQAKAPPPPPPVPEPLPLPQTPCQPPPSARNAKRRSKTVILAAIVLPLVLAAAALIYFTGRSWPRQTRNAAGLRIECELADARIYLDGILLGEPGGNNLLFAENLSPGVRQLKMVREGMTTIEQQVELTAGQTSTVTLRAQPVGRTLIVRSNRCGAAVKLGSLQVGATHAPCGEGCCSLIYFSPPAGRHLLRVEASGLPPFLSWLLIQDQPVIVDATMLAQAAERLLIVEDAPPACEIKLDGELFTGQTDLAPVLIPAAAGRHSLTIRQTGFETKTIDVVIRPEAHTTVHAQLDPLGS